MSFLHALEKKKQKEQSEKDKQEWQSAPLIIEGKNHLIELFVYIIEIISSNTVSF